MTSKKLRKYLAYYQKTLREEPENIEARLRLASIFREMGRIGHAVEEYVNASKLLAREGLPLEAIAACKAVLELEPNHTETQMFLARLFAQVPDATGVTARVARPMEQDDGQRRPRGQNGESSGIVASTDSSGTEDSQPIRLERPKQQREDSPQKEASGAAVDDQTRRADPAELPNFDDIEPPAEAHEDEQTRPAELALTGLEDVENQEADGSTVEMNAADRDEIALNLKNDVPDEDLRATADFDKDAIERYGEHADTPQETTLRQVDAVGRDDAADVDLYSDEFRSTQDVSEDDILEETAASPDESLRSTQDVDEQSILGEEVVDEEDLRATNELDSPRRGTRQLASVDRDRKSTSLGIPASARGGGESDDEETFEVGVFDMDSLGLDNTSTDWDDLSFLDELDEPETGEVNGDDFEVDTGEFGPAVLSVARSELPKIPLFSQLSPDLFAKLLRVMEVRTFDRGTTIVGDQTEEPSIWVIIKGQAAVSKEVEDGSRVELARLSEGDFFGEFLLLTGRTGHATVSAATELSLLELSEDVIEELARSNPQIWDVLWNFYYSRMLNNLLATSAIFRSLDERERSALAEDFTLEEIPAGEKLLGQGDRDDDLYLICNGVIRVEHEDRDGNTREIDTLQEGEFVGLISSAEEKPVIANIEVVEDATLLVLRGSRFREVMAEHPAVAREVDRAVRERKATAGRYTSGVTSYAELGIASPRDER